MRRDWQSQLDVRYLNTHATEHASAVGREMYFSSRNGWLFVGASERQSK